MFCTTTSHNSYNEGYDMTLNPIGSVAFRGISTKTSREYNTRRERKHWMRKAATKDREACSSSILSISDDGWTETDDNTSTGEQISWENRHGSEFQDNSIANLFDGNDYGRSLDLDRMVCEKLLPQVKGSKDFLERIRFCDSNSSTEFPEELVSADDQNCIRIPPLSPIYEFPQSPNHRVFPDNRNVISSPVAYKGVTVKDSDQVSKIGREQISWTFDDCQDGRFLFAMFDKSEELRILLCWRGLEVQNLWETRIPGLLCVLFRTCEMANQALTKQKEIGVRFVPHDNTLKYWHKGPSPKFHVIYETTRRLTVKSGKSLSNKTVGDLLMKNSRMDRGCIIWADQMKGYRLRVVGFVGKFVSKDGRVMVRDEPPTAAARKVLGWVSTRCNITKAKFVLRLNGKQIENYLCCRALE
jgi:hypothetical protein